MKLKLLIVASTVSFSLTLACADWTQSSFSQPISYNNQTFHGFNPRNDYNANGDDFDFHFTTTLQTRFVWGSTQQSLPVWNTYLSDIMSTPTSTTHTENRDFNNVISFECFWQFTNIQTYQSFTDGNTTINREGYAAENWSYDFIVVQS